MQRMLLLVFLCVACGFAFIQALECGLLDHATDEHFQHAMKKCMGKNYSNEDDDSNESAEDSKSGSKRKENKRSADVSSSREESGKSKKENDTKNLDKCALQCIYDNLNMTDENGYPTERQIKSASFKYARNKEAREFLADSIEECFELLQKGKKLDSCEYSNKLTTCLGDKGKSTCSDWEPINLQIH